MNLLLRNRKFLVLVFGLQVYISYRFIIYGHQKYMTDANVSEIDRSVGYNVSTRSEMTTQTPRKLKDGPVGKTAIVDGKNKQKRNDYNGNDKPSQKVEKKDVAPVHAPNVTIINIRYQNQLTDLTWKEKIGSYLKQHKLRCEREVEDKVLPAKAPPYCECLPSTLVGFQNVSFEETPLDLTAKKNPEVKEGGHWSPSSCTARLRIAIIIPFRDRQGHLNVLLKYLHPMLQGQQLDYTIYVVEQASPKLFSKSNIMNIGYMFANTSSNKPDCFIFHDVDMIPEDGRHFYWCRKDQPLHLGAFHDRHKYRVIYSMIFGGVTAFRGKQFEVVNGFSNRFFGWGGEDDDMSYRLLAERLRVSRDPQQVAGYTVIRHHRDKGNARQGPDGESKVRMIKLLRDQSGRRRDGLNTLKYKIREVKKLPLYTWVNVDVHNPDPLERKQ